MRPCWIAAAALAATLGVAGCEDPDASQASAPAEPGRRTSIPGKAMDRAEDLKKEVDAYNRQIEETIEQGTKASPSTPSSPPALPSGVP
jgi:hypothetical protein